MWPVSAQWAPALTRSHHLALRVEVWRGDTMLATTADGSLSIGDGTVNATARNRVRRTLSLTVPERFYPADDTDLLAPFGTEIRAYRGIDYGSSTELVPVFRGPIQDVDGRNRYGGSCEVSASDLGATLNDARFETSRAAPAGIATTAEIAALLAEATPDASIMRATTRDGTVAAGLSWDRDRGQAVDDLATSIGIDVWAGPEGGWHLTDPATLDQPPVWTLTDGADGTVVSDSRRVSRKGVYNVVVVTMERADGTAPSIVTVADTDPTSPTFIGGPFGRVPRFYRSPLVTSTGQARTAALALLAKSTGLTRTRTVTCVPNPALEIGDRIDIIVAGRLEQHIIDAFPLPLGPADAMQITTRSAKPADGDSENATT